MCVNRVEKQAAEGKRNKGVYIEDLVLGSWGGASLVNFHFNLQLGRSSMGVALEKTNNNDNFPLKHFFFLYSHPHFYQRYKNKVNLFAK